MYRKLYLLVVSARLDRLPKHFALIFFLSGFFYTEAYSQSLEAIPCLMSTNDTVPPVTPLVSGGCLDTTEVRYIRVNYHFFQDDDGTGNFTKTSDGNGNYATNGYLRAEGIVNSMNYEMANTAVQWRTSNPYRKPFIQYVLTGVYFHKSTFYNNRSLNYLSAMDPVFGVDRSTTINIFNYNFLESGSGGTYYLAKYLAIKDYEAYIDYPGWIEYPAQTINHEIGHTLRLRHTWAMDDDCDDTPLGYPCGNTYCQCWGLEGSGPCSLWENMSNNLMDYNQWYAHSLSPCQIDRMNETINTTEMYDLVTACGDCPPTSAFFDIEEEQCASNVTIEASASFNETEYKVEICEVTSPSAVGCIFGTSYSSGWISGQAEKWSLNSEFGYTFAKNKYYRITLHTRSECASTVSMTKTIKTKDQTPPCFTSTTPIKGFSVSPNPLTGPGTIYYEQEEEGYVTVRVENGFGFNVQTVKPGLVQPSGFYQESFNLSSQPPGSYYVIVSHNGIYDYRTVVRVP